MTVKTLIAQFETKTSTPTSTSTPTPAGYPAQGTVSALASRYEAFIASALASRYEAFIASADRSTRVVGSAPTPAEDHSAFSVGHDSPIDGVDSGSLSSPATLADDHSEPSIGRISAQSAEPQTRMAARSSPAASTMPVTPKRTRRAGRNSHANTSPRAFDYEDSPAWNQQRAANQASIAARRASDEQQPRAITHPSRANSTSTSTTTTIATFQDNRNQYAHVESRLFAFETSPDWIQQVTANQTCIQARRRINEQQRAATIRNTAAASSTPASPLRPRSMTANGIRRAGRDAYAHVRSRVSDFKKPSAPPQPVAAN